jgi:hypothetical protein
MATSCTSAKTERYGPLLPSLSPDLSVGYVSMYIIPNAKRTHPRDLRFYSFNRIRVWHMRMPEHRREDLRIRLIIQIPFLFQASNSSTIKASFC